jgi:hypothetical protein
MNHPAAVALSKGSASIAGEERSVSDIRSLAPVTDDDFAQVAAYISGHRKTWDQHLRSGLTALTDHLAEDGYTPRTAGPAVLGPRELMMSARLKDTAAIVAKMRRFGEPLRVMLDIWGYRVVVPTDHDLDDVAKSCAALWETPTPHELLLRHGELQFDWWRDYRQRNHAGLSPATTDRYDQAIHANRKAPFGIVEIQVMTRDLHSRVHGNPTSEDSHDAFVARRQALFRDRTP